VGHLDYWRGALDGHVQAPTRLAAARPTSQLQGSSKLAWSPPVGTGPSGPGFDGTLGPAARATLGLDQDETEEVA
jgi:hypothetical protein